MLNLSHAGDVELGGTLILPIFLQDGEDGFEEIEERFGLLLVHLLVLLPKLEECGGLLLFDLGGGLPLVVGGGGRAPGALAELLYRLRQGADHLNLI